MLQTYVSALLTNEYKMIRFIFYPRLILSLIRIGFLYVVTLRTETQFADDKVIYSFHIYTKFWNLASVAGKLDNGATAHRLCEGNFYKRRYSLICPVHKMRTILHLSFFLTEINRGFWQLSNVCGHCVTCFVSSHKSVN